MITDLVITVPKLAQDTDIRTLPRRANNMAIDIYNVTTAANTAVKPTKAAKSTNKSENKTENAAANAKTDSKKSTFSDTAAVYEKSESVSKPKNNSAIVAQLKADAEARQQQLLEIVRKSIGDQAFTFAKATNLKSVFENLNVDEDTRLQAQKDIAEDGYWGVNQTSDRIVDFAKALSGGDSSKAQELLDAFKKGFDQATAAWGDKLPDLCQKTYDAVLDKFQNWMDGTEQ